MANFDWETIRAEYEAGASQSELSRRHGVSRAAIQKRIKTEAKVAGVVAGCNPQKKAEALSRAAEDKAAVIRNHREAWDGFKQEVKAALESNDFDRLKCLKIASETLRNAQECERKAWGIQDKPTEAEQPTVQATAVNIDFSKMTPEEINALGVALMGAREQ